MARKWCEFIQLCRSLGFGPISHCGVTLGAQARKLCVPISALSRPDRRGEDRSDRRREGCKTYRLSANVSTWR